MVDYAQNPERPGQPVSRDKSQLLLGAALLIAGLIVLIDLSLVTSISAIAVGGVAIVVGLFALFERGTSRSTASLWWQRILGILYISFGLLLISRPEFQSAFLKLALAVALIGSGAVRIGLGFMRKSWRWLLVSGLIGVAGGIAIFLRQPFADLRFVALVLGIDLLVHGLVRVEAGFRGVRSTA